MPDLPVNRLKQATEFLPGRGHWPPLPMIRTMKLGRALASALERSAENRQHAQKSRYNGLQ
jgi:hypothetical protein